MYLLCNISDDLDNAASRVRTVLNLPPTNCPPLDPSQLRYGLNIGGGEYYLFDVLGVHLCFCCNEGEVKVCDEPEWPYYLWVHAAGDFADLLERAAERLNAEGIKTKLLYDT